MREIKLQDLKSKSPTELMSFAEEVEVDEENNNTINTGRTLLNNRGSKSPPTKRKQTSATNHERMT